MKLLEFAERDSKITPHQLRVIRLVEEWQEKNGRHKTVPWTALARSIGVKSANNFRQSYVRAENRAKAAGYVPEKSTEVIKASEVITLEQEHILKTQNKALRKENRELAEQLAEAKNLLTLEDGLSKAKVKPARIKRNPKKPQVAATAFLSDTHFDEVVSLEQTGGVNEYNRAIAEKRLSKFAEKTIVVTRDLMSGFDTTHLDLPFGGDMVSGNIHEELARSNEAEIMDTVDHWSEKLAEVVVTLAKEFNTIHIPCVVGNHGRNTKKPRHKGRIRDNFDWLIYRNVQRILKNNTNNVTMQISESTDVLWETMGHTYCLTHGDQASGGQGWGGIFSPITRLYEKKLKAYSGRNQRFDYLIMGHWHQFIDAGTIVVNGTTKGYDEFAHNLNFRPEPPQQAFWLTSPEHGKIMSGPILVGDG